MGKTRRQDTIEELTELKALKLKYEARKNQVKRLKKIISELEKKLEKYEAGITGTSDKGRPVKQPKPTPVQKSQDAKRELMDRLKAQFGAKKSEVPDDQT